MHDSAQPTPNHNNFSSVTQATYSSLMKLNASQVDHTTHATGPTQILQGTFFVYLNGLAGRSAQRHGTTQATKNPTIPSLFSILL